MKKENLTNLLSEIKRQCKVSEIDYIKIQKDGEEYELDKSWFLSQAKRISYDQGFGGHVIDTSLKIVLKNGNWLERGEYDGSEWFELKQRPLRSKELINKDISVIMARGNNCPYNKTKIDDQYINPPDKYSISRGYYTWHENSGKIELKFNEYKEKEEEYKEYSKQNGIEEE